MKYPTIWITDPHIPHVSDKERIEFFERFEKHKGDFFITGDYASAMSICRILKDIDKSAQGRVFTVLGNHDFYGSSIKDVRRLIGELGLGAKKDSGVFCFEPGLLDSPILLNEETKTYVVGTGGVGDGLAGHGQPGKLGLNDEFAIEELRLARNDRRLERALMGYGHEHAGYLASLLAKVPEDAKEVIVLTHVPPWPEATWHDGKPSDDDGLTRFCWLQGGVVIDAAAKSRPNLKIQVYCGHTHTGGQMIKDNIVCYTGGNRYGQGHVNGLVWCESTGYVLERLDGELLPNGCLDYMPTPYQCQLPPGQLD